MGFANATVLTVALASLAPACSGSVSSGSGGLARVSLDGVNCEVQDVSTSIEPGEDAWFRIEGKPAAHQNEDYVSGLGGRQGLYDDLPSSVRGTADLQDLRRER